MRWWPFGRRVKFTASAVSPDALLVTQDLLRRNMDDVFVVRQEGARGHGFLFGGELLVSPTRALATLEARFKPHGYTPFLTREQGLTWVQALRRGDVVGRPRSSVNVVLFILTCVSTLVAGWGYAGSPTFDALRGSPGPASLLAGVPFAATLLVILGVHEFGHYFTARAYGASVSLPYFIPAPPPMFFGTFGAIIRMRSPARDRNSLFDIAVAGPLAGLAVALPALIIGLGWSGLVPAVGHGHIVFGSSLLVRALVALRFGTIPDGMMLFTHPVADAAWVGLFVTALNLFPVGQLDGGRIAYALFGAQHRKVSVGTFLALLALGVVSGSPNWYVFAGLLAFLVGFHHAPPLDDLTPLSPGRYAVGVFCLLLLVLLVPPVPIQLE